MSDDRKFRRKRKGAVTAHLKEVLESPVHPEPHPTALEDDLVPEPLEEAAPRPDFSEPVEEESAAPVPAQAEPVEPLALTPDLQTEDRPGPTISPPVPQAGAAPDLTVQQSPKPALDELPQDRIFSEEERQRQRQAKLKALREALPEERTAAPLTLSEPVVVPSPEPQPALQWDRLSELSLSAPHLSQHHVVTAERTDPAHSAFDVLRTRLLQALSDNGWSRVAITSPTKDCGKTFTAANLAISLARQENCRTVLMDLDMRRPSLHRVLGVDTPGSMGDVLRGTLAIEEHFKRLGENDFHGGRNIAFGFNDVIEPFAAELLQDPRANEVMNTIQQAYQPDVMLFDLPPALYYDDVIAFRPQFDGVLLVIGGGLTTEKEIREVERRLGDTTPLLGMVLNKAENADFQKYQY